MEEKKDNKKEKDKKEKRMVTHKLFKNINDEEFLTSSEEFDDSVSFPNEIYHISEITKKVDKINILSTNKHIICKNISSTSSSNKFKDINNKKEEEKEIEEEEYNKDKLSITQNNIIYYDEKDIEDSKDNDIENIIINTNNHNNDNDDSFSSNNKRDKKMSKLNHINKSNLFTSGKGIPRSINLSFNNNNAKNIVNNKNNKEDDKIENNINNISNLNDISNISSSKSKNSNSNSNSDSNSILNNNKNNLFKNDKEQIHVNKSRKSFFSLHSNKNNFDNIDSERSFKSLNNKNKTQNQFVKNINFNIDQNSPFQSQGEEDIDKNIINLKPINNVVKTYKNKEEICAAETIVNENTNCKLGESGEKVQKNIKPENKPTKKLPPRRFSLNSNNTSIINNFNKKKQEEKQISFATWIEKKLINFPLLIFISILHLFSLFSSDVKHLWLSTKVDLYFDIVNFIILIYLIIEMIFVYILDEFYLNTFIFWIDILGVISVLFDIELFVDLVLGYGPIDKNFENKTITNSVEYLVICIMMLGRAIRASKIFRILKIYNLINTKKKFKDIYTEMQKRDIVTEEQNKQKLIQKIQILEASDSESDDSSSSENSFHNSDEESNSSIKNSPIIKRSKSIAENKINLQIEQVVSKDMKNVGSNKKKSKIFQRKNSLRFLRQNSSIKFNFSGRNSVRNSVVNIENSHIFNYEEMDGKKIENEKKLKEKREEEVYEKMDEAIKNTKITSKVNSSVRKKLIFFLLIILLVCIILNEEIFSNFKDDISSYNYLYEAILYYSSHNDSSKDKIKNFLSSVNENDFPVINITDNDIIIYENEHLTRQNLRYCELIKISLSSDKNEVINIVYSKKKDSNLKHILLFLGTLLVCLSLILSSIFFEKDLTNILLSPIEVMIVIANKVANDPMNAKNIEDLEQDIINMLPKRNKAVNKNEKDKIELNQNYYESYNCYEVQTIMTAIIKVSALLAMSVGEAGGEIIHKNLSSHHELHLHSKGKRKSAIFGFCNIRNFNEINLALEEKTIPLINIIAEIVHSSVDKFRGSTNKNIGNTFLNVWKFYNNINMKNGNNVIRVKNDNLLEIDPINPQIGITADCAVLAYLRCLLKINKNLNILEYKKNKILKGIIPNFKIDMGFGLHLGYGIEGPVGSIFKIEVSYLSPNVNIASRLETATKQFGVNLLISGELYNLFTDEMKGICRYVDCVTVKGSSEPIKLYTIDINCNVTKQKAEKLKIIEDQKEKAKIFKEKKIMLENLIEQYGSVCSIILEKESYMELLDEKSEEFYDSWEEAMELYKKGKWTEAKIYFEECIKEDPNDGPSNTLYNYIKKFNFESPKNWKGERELTSK